MAKLALGLLFAPLDRFLATAKDLLGARLSVQDDTQGRRHVHTLLVVIVVEVLAGKITLIPVNKINLVRLRGRLCIDGR